MSKNQHLHDILDVEKWQILQDSIAAVSGMAIITSDYKGLPITVHSERRKFCELVRNDLELSKQCEKCDSRGGLEAVRLNQPYIYRCHFNILDAAIPIIVDNRYLGAIMVGQVILPDREDMGQLEQICAPSNFMKLSIYMEQYRQYYELIPKMSLARIKIVVEMLFHLCNYIVTEAMEKNLAILMGIHQNNKTAESVDLIQYPTSTLEHFRSSLNRVITNANLQEVSFEQNETKTDLLKPAIEYMKSHQNENITLSKMAALCHISPSYFSRLFNKQMGEGFSNYLNRQKVNYSKSVLEKTNRSISEIALEAGFSDAAHFIRTFKKYEGVTPARYRQYLER